MTSPQTSSPHPPRLEGASRTSGGILRGKAFGNVFNHADLSDIFQDSMGAIKGRVFVYLSNHDPASFDFETSRPSFFFKHDVTATVSPLLQEMGRRYEPVASKFYPKYISLRY